MTLPAEAERRATANTIAADIAVGSLKSDYDNKNLPEVVLPGYEADINQSGVQHSRLKLQGSANRLFATLGSIQNSQSSHLNEQVINPDHPQSSTIGGLSKGCIQTLYCSDEKETWTYRCRCNFQIVLVVDPDGLASYRYAMRSMGKPVLLGTKNSFPIATQRIQTAMDEFMQHLNSKAMDVAEGDIVGQNGHLASCTFSSAWRDIPDADCVLTLHYDHPLDSDENSKNLWIQQAKILCQKMRLRQLNGRSKGTLLSAQGGNMSTNDESQNDTNEAEATIRDTIYLLRNGCKTEADSNAVQDEWRVCLDNNNAESRDAKPLIAIPVHYDKPETAFYHPNANAMSKALSWMLNRLTSIAFSSTPNQKLNLLEMYCGCGAHTVAIGRSGLVSNIIAVELDPRLVRACEANIAKNSLQDLVEVRKGDAGRWAREESRKRRSRKNRAIAGDEEKIINRENYYDVLLVDPPRQGLDEEVCKMAMMSIDGEIGSGESCFRNLLYVSCGHKALLRDLERLSPFYEVVNCAQMDLFPRTDSIETLVHLQRRQGTKNAT